MVHFLKRCLRLTRTFLFYNIIYGSELTYYLAWTLNIGVDVLRKVLQGMGCVEREVFLRPHAEQKCFWSPFHLGGWIDEIDWSFIKESKRKNNRRTKRSHEKWNNTHLRKASGCTSQFRCACSMRKLQPFVDWKLWIPKIN
jgi:hypothetical protein